MKCSEQVKLAGLKSLCQLSEITGVAETTLRDWSKNKHKLFEIVLKGAVCEMVVDQRKYAVNVSDEILERLGKIQTYPRTVWYKCNTEHGHQTSPTGYNSESECKAECSSCEEPRPIAIV
jgi:hypothetical protein